MFEFLFKYPRAVFSKGDFVLLGTWPKWALIVLLLATAVGLAWIIRARLPAAAAHVKNWRVWIIWLLQFCMAALLLLLLWQPAMTVAELKPQQNVIAVVVDDSRSMAIQDAGGSRESQAVKALQNGVLAQLQKKFQTRLYRLDGQLSPISSLDGMQATASATRIGNGLRQLAAASTDLPIGAIVLLTDGANNSGGIGLGTMEAVRNRRIPVHTVGFGQVEVPNDVEINDVTLAPRALADSRLAAKVTFHQRGFSGQKSTLTVRDGDKVLAAHPVTFASDGKIQTDTILFSSGNAGAKTLRFSIAPLQEEENRSNNSVTRLVNVESNPDRILYIEGEPRWEYKFVRRAVEDDHIIKIASMLRTSENKIYRQGIDNPQELADGFPSRAEDLFKYQGLIIGSVAVSYFTPVQRELIREFVDQRGGGLLMLGGRFALADGGWGSTGLADLLPVVLPNRKNTFRRDPATVELTPAGADSLITRLVEDPTKNVERWKKLPYLMDYQEVGKPKPGAVVLADMMGGGRKMPFLITQNYGRGRVAVVASSGTWRWQMSQPVKDQTHETFWRQLLRWLVANTPGHVVASVPNQMLFDTGQVRFSAEVRDKNYMPAADATVQAHILGPGGSAATVEMSPDPNSPGVFHADWNAAAPGSYLTEVVARRGKEEIGRDVLTFERMDGVAENFHTGQDRELLQKLSAETGGRYWRPQDLSRLPNEISYSEAGITVRETKDLWNMPAIFILLLMLKSAEWLLRRRWGVV